MEVGEEGAREISNTEIECRAGNRPHTERLVLHVQDDQVGELS